jgi:hypothetical protein
MTLGLPLVSRLSKFPARLHVSNATSGPLSSGQFSLKLIGDWGEGSMRSSRRTKVADERDWYSWLLPGLCLMLLTVLLFKHL